MDADMSALVMFSVAIAFSPGPATLMALARGTTAVGIAGIGAFAAGCAAAYGLIWGVAASSTRYIAELSPEAFAAIRWVAGALLLWIALRMLRSAFRPADVRGRGERSVARAAGAGAGMALGNPKCWTTAVVAAALFCDPELSTGGHALLFGGVAGISVALACAAYGWAGTVLSARLTGPGGRRWLTVGAAALMAASAVTIT